MCCANKCGCGCDDIMKECGCDGQRSSKYLLPSLLLLLAEKASYGYQLMDNVDRAGLQEGPPDPAAIYRSLRQMEEEGVVRSKWDTRASGPARRLYTLTPRGHELLEAWMIAIGKQKERLERFLARHRAAARKTRRKIKG